MSRSLTPEEVDRALTAGLGKAEEIGVASSVAIVDRGRELLAFRRQDGAPLASIEISQNKAYTSASLGMDTKDLGSLAQPGQPLYGIDGSHQRPLIVFAGGRPLTIDGELAGAIGAAGGSPDEDHEVATAVVEALS